MFGFLKLALAVKMKQPIDSLQIRFDGEVVGDEKTPLDLDLEDEDCLDVVVIGK
jgi:hypothetical protein